MKNYTSLFYKLLIVLLGLFALSIQLDIFNSINLKNLNYFTLISNLLCVIYFILDIIYIIIHKNDIKKKTFLPCVKGAVTISIMLTMIVAATLLNGNFPSKGLVGLSFIILHVIEPLLVFIDWLIFDKKGQYKVTYPITWTIIPALYYIYIIIGIKLGYSFGLTSKYPYDFQDVSVNGYQKVIITDIIIALLFIAFGYLYYYLDKKLVKKTNKKRKKK